MWSVIKTCATSGFAAQIPSRSKYLARNHATDPYVCYRVDPIARGRLEGLWPTHVRSRDRFRRWRPDRRRVLLRRGPAPRRRPASERLAANAIVGP
jgi:hypothetical protein